MDERAFVVALMAALPEAFAGDVDYDLDGEPLTYPALADARIWLEEHALKLSILPRRARVRPEGADAVKRFWDFVEEQATAGKGDTELETLLAIECFEGVVWVQDVGEYLGPATRDLLEGPRPASP
jgi:hypothetical protein